MTLRPYGIILDGNLELGLEVVCEGGSIREVRPHTGVPESYVLSPAFVNAHSHLEYRGMLGSLSAGTYWEFIREITQLKRLQMPDAVERDCEMAAQENRAAGIGWIAEHSDRPYSAGALKASGFAKRARVFQEVITFLERDDPAEKLANCRRAADSQAAVLGRPVFLTPHTAFTVDPATLKLIADAGEPTSIHVAETSDEAALFADGSGEIGEFFASHSAQIPASCTTPAKWLIELGFGRSNTQFVHCCAIDNEDIEALRDADVAVAHCPRSNTRLRCPTAPVRRLLEAGVRVGLGLDSAASGGPIDMFAEMREAVRVSESLGEPITAVTAWNLATTAGRAACSFGDIVEPWAIVAGQTPPMVKLHVPGATSTEEMLERVQPDMVEWVV